MIRISSTQLWVHDQNAALEFYTRQVGMELRTDVTVAEMGNFRWLTVGPAAQPDIEIVLMAVPGEPMIDAVTSGQIEELMSKGFAGTVFLTTDDVHAAYKEMGDRGVVFNDPPTQMPYGIDTSFRDPSGNNIRLVQLAGSFGQ